MNCYTQNRNWSDQFLPTVKQIVGEHMIRAAPDLVDMREATDLMTLDGTDKRIAVRIRRYGIAKKYPYQFTVRAKVKSGVKTELAKIVDGYVDWMFYGHANFEGNGLALWWLLDLNAFRSALIRRDRNPIKYGDVTLPEGTCFWWFDIRSFQNSDKLVVATSQAQQT